MGDCQITFSGKKKFMLGDQASQTDCAVFGMLSQIHWHSFGGAGEKLYKSKYFAGKLFLSACT